MKRNLLAVTAFALWSFYAVACYAEGKSAYQLGDYATAYKEWKPLAEQGDASSQYNLGLLYSQGLGVKQDYKAAKKWYRKAAEQGNARAQYHLGLLYYGGYGVQPDYKAAEEWFRKAGEQGNTSAQDNLGLLYYRGHGVQPDYKAAEEWFRKAGEQGKSSSQYYLGLLYINGLGVTSDYVEAYKWFNLAAANGDQFALGERDKLAKSMTTAQVAEAKILSFRAVTKMGSAAKSDFSCSAVDWGLVSNIQSHLKALGYAPGPVNGVPSRRTGVPSRHTIAAVKSFQREWDIQPDGIISSSLLKILEIALEAKSKPSQSINKSLQLAGSGSGFTVGGGDYAVTNHHVTSGCSKLTAYINGSPVAGSVVAFSKTDDLALIKLAKRASYQASFRGSGRARLGEDIWVVGYPLRTLLASGLNVVSGEISALAGLGDNNKVMQISAPVQLGSSGGPILDSSGNLIGVVVSKLDAKRFSAAIGDIPQNINFAIKGTVVKSFLDIHGIDYKIASTWAWTEKNGEEIAIKARKFTVPIECYK